MFSALLRAIFLPKATRELLEERARVDPRLGPRLGPSRAAASGPGDRTAVMQDAMSVYRQKRGVYESLDEETRQQIEADAAKLFGDLGKRQR